jgi:hypothetical protein
MFAPRMYRDATRADFHPTIRQWSIRVMPKVEDFALQTGVYVHFRVCTRSLVRSNKMLS